MKNLYTKANILNSVNISIGNATIPFQFIISLEIVYDINSPIVYGNVIISDLFDANSVIDWKSNLLSVQYVDAFNIYFGRTFVIKNVQEKVNERLEKMLYLEIQDTTSFILESSFISKSFYSNPKDALLDYLDDLSIKTPTDLTEITDKFNFVIPNHKNNLESFTEEFNKYGLYFYQNKGELCLKSVDDLADLKENDEFVDFSVNQLYYNLIHDYIVVTNDRDSTPIKTNVLAFDIHSKKMIFEEPKIDEFVLNDDNRNLQTTIDLRHTYQTHLNFNQYRKEMRDLAFSQNRAIITVNGYVKNDLNMIYDLKFSGNKSSIESSNKGNYLASGKYVSTKIVDKIVLGHMLQKVYLSRPDTQKRI